MYHTNGFWDALPEDIDSDKIQTLKENVSEQDVQPLFIHPVKITRKSKRRYAYT